MATKSSYLLAVLLIANPFMLLVFQNCSASPNDRNIASAEPLVQLEKPAPAEFSVKINEKLEIK